VKPKTKKRPAARTKSAKPKEPSIQERIAVLAERVEYDLMLPSMLTDMLGIATAWRFQRPTQVHFDVQPALPQPINIGMCSQRHIHVVFNGDVTLSTMNIAAVLAWSIALCCDRLEVWSEKPTTEGVIAAMREIVTDSSLEEMQPYLMSIYDHAEELIVPLLGKDTNVLYH